MRADEIIAAARECLNTPFQHQGRILGLALDCAGVVVHVFNRVGCEVDQPAAYSRTPHNAMLEYWADRQPFLTRATTPQSGDILLMRFGGEPQHVAVFTGENLIHAYESIGRVVEHRMDEKWRKRIVRVYRLKGIENKNATIIVSIHGVNLIGARSAAAHGVRDAIGIGK